MARYAVPGHRPSPGQSRPRPVRHTWVGNAAADSDPLSRSLKEGIIIFIFNYLEIAMRSAFGTALALSALLAAATALAMPVVPAPLPGQLSVLVAETNKETHTVHGYVRKDGTYVKPHRQTDPDANKNNNFSTEGNTNPYTGEKGDVDPAKKTKKKK
jgi:hypothetical protein